jgi:hypothetical protein
MALKLDNGGVGFFKINEDLYPTGSYRIVYRENNIGIEEVGGHDIVFPTRFSEWTDAADQPYASLNDLLDDLRSKIFR